MTLSDALADPKLLAPHFAGPTWDAWRTLVRALEALPLTEAQLQLYRECTGRTEPPTAPATEIETLIGRRGGKSRMAAAIAVYLAAFRDYRAILAPGERGVLPIIASDRRQARVVFNYVKGLLEQVPMLRRMLVGKPTMERIELRNHVTLEVHTASFRAVRGLTVVGAICDEVAFWRSDDSANPDREIYVALRPAMATVPGALLVTISTPYARRGVVYETFAKHYGKAGDVLVWRAPTRTMNPAVPQAFVDQALADDPAAAAAEYLAEFRSDVESYITREAIDACTVPGRLELPPLSDVTYRGFVDASGGSGGDSFTLGIAHVDGERVVLDCVRERRPPFSPDSVVAEYAAVLTSYGVTVATADKYAGGWVAEAFAKHGVHVEQNAEPKAALYRETLPLLNAGRVELLAVPRLAQQLLALERRTRAGGADIVDHPPGGHDDVANATAGAVVSAWQRRDHGATVTLAGRDPDVGFGVVRFPRSLPLHLRALVS